MLGIAGQPIACFNDFAQANHSADGMMRSRPVVTYWTSGSVVCSGYSGVSQQWMSALTLTPFYTPKALSRRPGKTDDYGDNAASFFWWFVDDTMPTVNMATQHFSRFWWPPAADTFVCSSTYIFLVSQTPSYAYPQWGQDWDITITCRQAKHKCRWKQKWSKNWCYRNSQLHFFCYIRNSVVNF